LESRGKLSNRKVNFPKGSCAVVRQKRLRGRIGHPEWVHGLFWLQNSGKGKSGLKVTHGYRELGFTGFTSIRHFRGLEIDDR
jgi:hypothetical protein